MQILLRNGQTTILTPEDYQQLVMPSEEGWLAGCGRGIFIRVIYLKDSDSWLLFSIADPRGNSYPAANQPSITLSTKLSDERPRLGRWRNWLKKVGLIGS